MEYILTAGWDDGIADLTERLARELSSGKRVLWLVSGGSNIQPATHVMYNISARLSKKLTVLLVDERYGPEGHKESNWKQLLAAGFDGGNAKLLPVLQKGLNFKQTISRYNQLAEKAFAENDIIVAQLGLGTDGHIAGIMPDSPAIKETKALVIGFKYPPLVRMTLTFPALRKIDVAFTFAFGNTKQKMLQALYGESLSVDVQPAQILKELPEAYLYSDQVGMHG